MLPKIISNITLAVIAIFIIYTLFPVISETILTFFGIKINKKNSKDNFDEMIERKKEILSRGSSHSPTTSVKSQTTRDELDYLYENNFFTTQNDYNYIINLKKEISWGSGEYIKEVQNLIQDSVYTSIDSSLVSSYLKLILQRKNMIEQFPEKGITKEKFLQIIVTNIICNKFDEINLEKLSMKLKVQSSSLKTIFSLIIAKEQNQEIGDIIGNYINNKNNPLKIVKSIPIKDFLNRAKEILDLIIPLEIPSKELLLPLEDSEVNSKRLKKLLVLYHPDKWNYCEKTEIIDKRLRENFDIIQNLYTKGKQNG